MDLLGDLLSHGKVDLAQKLASMEAFTVDVYNDYDGQLKLLSIADQSPAIAAELVSKGVKISVPLIQYSIDKNFSEVVDAIFAREDFNPNIYRIEYLLSHGKVDLAQKLVSMEAFTVDRYNDYDGQLKLLSIADQSPAIAAELVKKGVNHSGLLQHAIVKDLTEVISAIFTREDFNPNINVNYSTTLADFCVLHGKINLLVQILSNPKLILNDNLSILDLLKANLSEAEYSAFLDTTPAIVNKILVAKLYRGTPDDIKSIKEVVTNTNLSGEFTFKVNDLDADGKRMIDHVAELVTAHRLSIDFVKTLRECGSVEPATPIKLDQAATERMDLSNAQLDTAYNGSRVVPLIHKMYEKYPLSDAEIDGIILDYEGKDFGVHVTEWGANVDTIPQVVHLLASRVITDRISQPVSCKKMLATVIHIVQQNSDRLVSHPAEPSITLLLPEMFKATLCSLRMCDLGKLVNIIASVQDFIVSVDEIDYSQKDFDTEFMPVLSMMPDLIENKLGDKAEKAIAEWMYDMYGSPEKWTPLTQTVHAIINREFIHSGFITAVDSYHFTGIMNHAIKVLAERLNPSQSPQSYNDFGAWSKCVELGIKHMAKDVCAEAVRLANAGEGMEQLFSSVGFSNSSAFGLFGNVSTDVFTDAIDDLPEAKVAEFIVRLINACELSKKTMTTLAKFLVVETHTNPQGVVAALELCDGVMNCIPAKHKTILTGFMEQHHEPAATDHSDISAEFLPATDSDDTNVPIAGAVQHISSMEDVD